MGMPAAGAWGFDTCLETLSEESAEVPGPGITHISNARPTLNERVTTFSLSLVGSNRGCSGFGTALGWLNFFHRRALPIRHSS
jgi:hypothetical protein